MEVLRSPDDAIESLADGAVGAGHVTAAPPSALVLAPAPGFHGPVESAVICSATHSTSNEEVPAT